MVSNELVAVANRYAPKDRDALIELSRDYRLRNEREVLDVAALAVDVSADSLINLGLEPDANPQLLEAFQLQYQNVELDSLTGRSDEALEGFVNGVKGKYFEVLVRDRLNAGERLGDIQLEGGQVAVLAESATQPGWDLQIVNEDGTVAESMQLKATESLSYVKEALDKYPGIRVLTPEEIDGASDDILNAGMSFDDIENETRKQLDELSDTTFDNIVDNAGEIAFDTVPFLAIFVTGVSEGRNVLMGRSTVRELFRRGATRIGKASVYNNIAALLGPFGTITSLGLRTAEGRIRRRISIAEVLESNMADLRRLSLN